MAIDIIQETKEAIEKAKIEIEKKLTVLDEIRRQNEEKEKGELNTESFTTETIESDMSTGTDSTKNE